MKAVFKELSIFERKRSNYLSDDEFREFQTLLMDNPCAGAVIKDTGGLRKIRFGDKRRGKGKRGGIRVIYYWYDEGLQFWLFTLYDKDESDDLTAKQRSVLKELLEHEVKARGN
ncbi:toxin [Zooshikella harenae]|uniref:Toxin n=1 Tax=Zooshikella harenae TaxID=2827238 RepID=A0ABS5ZIT2_9GAMM|nr:toxin [Zooshikella harenae]MBU2713703.1 toxin [Zooshikella harenae]